jgi:hypothetical protein
MFVTLCAPFITVTLTVVMLGVVTLSANKSNVAAWKIFGKKILIFKSEL